MEFRGHVNTSFAGMIRQPVHPGGWPRIYPYDGWRSRLAETLSGY